MKDLIRQYFEILEQWNRKINLTAIEGWEAFRDKHLEDALPILPHLGAAKTLLDIGTGAGIPGIILKIARPDIEVTLLDSTRKKVSFCDEAIRRLGLTGIRAVRGRAEDKSVVAALGRFDLVVSRATWDLAKFLKIALPYIADGGRCIAMKGKQWHEELEAAAPRIATNTIALDGTHPYRLRGGEERCLLVFAPCAPRQTA
ncbi:MAG: 16S rRNA (guanine(527)-N(7))-methyltransferase RsmG [Pseudomonadota bacterium]